MQILGMGPVELILILVVAVIVFGPRRLPEIASSAGKAMREFRKVTSELTKGVMEEVETEEGKVGTRTKSEAETVSFKEMLKKEE